MPTIVDLDELPRDDFHAFEWMLLNDIVMNGVLIIAVTTLMAYIFRFGTFFTEMINKEHKTPLSYNYLMHPLAACAFLAMSLAMQSAADYVWQVNDLRQNTALGLAAALVPAVDGTVYTWTLWMGYARTLYLILVLPAMFFYLEWYWTVAWTNVIVGLGVIVTNCGLYWAYYGQIPGGLALGASIAYAIVSSFYFYWASTSPFIRAVHNGSADPLFFLYMKFRNAKRGEPRALVPSVGVQVATAGANAAPAQIVGQPAYGNAQMRAPLTGGTAYYN